MTAPRILLVALCALVVLAGCGSSSRTSATTSTSSAGTATTAPQTTARTSSGSSPSALQAEANSAAAGDIPDNQVFVLFRNAAGGYSMKYPEGWVQQGTAAKVIFRDKNNIVRVVVGPGALLSAGSIRHQLAGLPGAHVRSGPRPITISGGRSFKVVYTSKSAPSSVTGKRVTLVVDRYYLSHAGKEAIVDLGTPQGVDNVDAYRLMIESFRWR